MGQIKLKWYYTNLVEHFFRLAVRYSKVSGLTPKKWFDFTKDWINKLSDEDREFIYFVFDYKFYNTAEGLYCYESDECMYSKRERLALIEKRFAIDGGLYAEAVE
jgi:hypothetical protein